MTVLVADDYAPLRAAIRDILEAMHHHVIEAEDGAAALEAIASHDVELVVLDLHMPVCDGFEVLRRLVGPRPPVIVLTGFEGQSRAKVEAEFGDRVFRCLRKPVSAFALIAAVNGALGEPNRVVTTTGFHSAGETMELRRRAPRVTAKGWWGRWAVEDDLEPAWNECQMVDVSLLGAGVDLCTDRADDLMGRRLVLEVWPPDGDSVSLRFAGIVRWIRQQSALNVRVGLKFEHLSGAAQDIVRVIEQLHGRW